MGKKEELTDMMTERCYTDKDAEGNYVFHKGKLLKFNYEGSVTSIKITRIDRVNKRMWGEHVELFDAATVYSHRGHAVDNTEDTVKTLGVGFCTDCEVPITEPSTEDGEVRAADRSDKELSDGTSIE